MLVKPRKFAILKSAHNREKAEDYVEAIQMLMKEHGEARLTDLAKHFGVSTVTAHKVLARLQREELISTQPYRAIFLTKKGQKLAQASQKRHHIVYRFLRELGVPEEAAQIDAEGIEHHVSPATIACMKRHLKKY